MVRLANHEVQQLLALRLAVERARRDARRAGRYQRGAAIVALDSNVERACALVAVARGLGVPSNGKLDDLVSQVKQSLGAAWQPTVLPDIKQLRRARNSAQHEGLEPDRDQVPLWAAAVESFVETLIYAHFNVDIFRVRLADAIKDPSLAKLLRQADADLEAKDFRGAVDHAAEAYQAAATAWRSLHPRRTSASSVRSQLAGKSETQTELDALKATLQAGAFASDGAEAEWFIQTIAERGDVHDQDDADRAISFAFVWVLGYEAAAATWVSDRQHRAALAARLVRNAESTTARIADCIDVSMAHDRIRAVFRLADVPSETAYPKWARSLVELLRTETTANWWVNSDGTIQVDRPQEEGDELEDDARRLAAILPMAELQLAVQRQEAQARAQMLEARKTQIDRDLMRLRPDWPEWVENISWSSESMGGTGERWLIALTSRASRIGNETEGTGSVSSDVRAMLLDLPEVNSCYWMGRVSLLAVEPVLDASSLVASLRAIDPAISQAISDLAIAEDQAENRRMRILADIRSTIKT